MMEFIASAFGYVLNFIYELVKNYGIAIILFSILLKLIMLPLSIKQQKQIKKSMKIQEKSKEIQEKYKNDKEKMNKEIMDLYKKENMSPLSGCLTTIIQVLLIFAIFFLVRSPLTHMIKMDTTTIENYVNEAKLVAEEKEQKISYPEIAVIKLSREKLASEEEIEENKKEDYEKMALNMDFLGVDLTNVPTQDMSNPTVYIIPGLYIFSSFVSIWITNRSQKKMQANSSKTASEDPTAGATKAMLWFMPIMSISIAMIAPLGLALYWLINNILIMIERLIIDYFIKDKEEDNGEKKPIEVKKIEEKKDDEEEVIKENKKEKNKEKNNNDNKENAE